MKWISLSHKIHNCNIKSCHNFDFVWKKSRKTIMTSQNWQRSKLRRTEKETRQNRHESDHSDK